MVTGSQLQQDSIERARAQGLESVIRSLANDRQPRRATRRTVEHRRAALLRQVCDPRVAAMRLERIMQGNDLADISYLAQGLVAARSVCRVVIRAGGNAVGYGTGFLVAPGVMLTNHHVLGTVDEVRESAAEFRFER